MLNKLHLYIIVLIALLFILSCNDKKQKAESQEKSEMKIDVDQISPPTAKSSEIFKYEIFKVDTLTSLKIKGFEILNAYQINNIKIAEGYYTGSEGKFVTPVTPQSDGRRLLTLNSKNEIKSIGKDVGDLYYNQPNFYRNMHNGNIIIVCQLAYEYFFGGEAYLLKGDQLTYIGNIDVESKNMEISLIDILKITEKDQLITFSFASDSIFLKPGNEDQLVKNTNIRYEYDYKTFKLNR